MEKCKFIFIIGNDKLAFNELITNLIYNYDGYKQSENYFIIRLNEELLKNNQLLYSLIKSHTMIFNFRGYIPMNKVYSNYKQFNSILLYFIESLKEERSTAIKLMEIIDSDDQNQRSILLNEFLEKQLHQQINFKYTLSQPELIELLEKCNKSILECYFINHSQFYQSIQCIKISEEHFFELMREKEFFENLIKTGKNCNSREESQCKTLKENQLDQNSILNHYEQGKQSNQETHKSDSQQCTCDEKNMQQKGENVQNQNKCSESSVQQLSQSCYQKVLDKNQNEEETKKQELMRSNYQNQQSNVGYCQKSFKIKNEPTTKQNNKICSSEIVSRNSNYMSEFQQRKRNPVVGDLNVLLLSIEEIQDFIFKPLHSKNKLTQTNKFEFLKVKDCNLTFHKSPLFLIENEEIILQFKNFFQRNQVNIILFCITIQRNDIMKQRIDKMVTKFVGVNRAQLGILIFNPYQQLTQTEFDYLQNLKLRLKFQFFCLVNQDDTEAQILNQLLPQFYDITPQKLDLRETEFAEETEEDKKQQKQLEISLFNMQLQSLQSHIQTKQNQQNIYIQEIKEEEQKIQELKKQLYQSEQIKKEKEFRRKEVKYEIDTLQTKYENLRKKIQYKF